MLGGLLLSWGPWAAAHTSPYVNPALIIRNTFQNGPFLINAEQFARSARAEIFYTEGNEVIVGRRKTAKGRWRRSMKN